MIEFPFFNMQQLNLDWIIDKIKGMLSFLPDDGTAGQILRRTADGAEWSDETGDSVESVNGKTGVVVLDSNDILMDDNSSVEDAVSDLKSAIETELTGYVPFNLIANSYVATNGTISAYNGWSRTGYIPIRRYYRLIAKTSVRSQYNCFYGANKEFITSFAVETTDTPIIVPKNAVYAIFSNTNAGMAEFEIKDVSSAKLKNEFSNLNTALSVGSVAVDVLPGYWSTSNGTFIYSNSTLRASEKINIVPNDIVSVSEDTFSSGQFFFLFWDSEGNYLSQTTSKTAIVPSDAYYCAVDFASELGLTKAPITVTTPLNVSKRWTGKKWVVLGDSLTELNSRTTKHYFNYISENTGISVYNMGNSGSGYMREQDLNTAFYQRITNVPTDADVITIFGSLNDLGGGYTLGTATDTGTTTIGGCINQTFDNLFAAYPLAIVGVVTPTPWQNQNPLAEPNAASQYVDLIKAVCARRSIPCLDLFHESLLRPWDSDFRTLAYSKDDGNGTHPDETGHKIIAPRFKAFLETLLM